MAKDKKPTEAAGSAETAQADISPAEAVNAENEAARGAAEHKNEPTYTAAEYARAADTVFHGKYNADIVRTAFLVAGVKEATKTEAEKIVEDFANKEVSEK